MSKQDVRPILLSMTEKKYFSENIKLFESSCLLAEGRKMSLAHGKKHSSSNTGLNQMT